MVQFRHVEFEKNAIKKLSKKLLRKGNQRKQTNEVKRTGQKIKLPSDPSIFSNARIRECTWAFGLVFSKIKVTSPLFKCLQFTWIYQIQQKRTNKNGWKSIRAMGNIYLLQPQKNCCDSSLANGYPEAVSWVSLLWRSFFWNNLHHDVHNISKNGGQHKNG